MYIINYYKVTRAEIFKSSKSASVDHRIIENDNIYLKKQCLEQNQVAGNKSTIKAE